MAKRNDIQSVLILGAGPIIIGQACEFDYSGTQACKALKEEGIRVILVNSNPATIMTDAQLADATYIEPIDWQVVAKIIEYERPDAILPTMGGQTALNCALDLAKYGILEKFGVQMIGATPDAIDKAEDRKRFDIAMKKIGLDTARSGIATSMQEAYKIAEELGFPCIIRPSFTMGGTGGGIAYCLESFTEICLRGLDLSPTHSLLIDESLIGWKEYEMEVVRDKKDNCIIVCSIENFDPMGIHTGDSITVAPAQTLTDRDYQKMRQASFAILREIGVETGGSNVQFAINPDNGRMIVIEMNPRVSRSSALASKATGFPIAKIAAKLAIGYTLDELDNDITGGKSPASFEPSIDYVVTKVPRFNFEKFPDANDRLTTQMKSVGESMALGHNFKSSLQKALRSLEIGVNGLESFSKEVALSLEALKDEMRQAGPHRIFYLAEAFRKGLSLEEIHQITFIDRWFLVQIKSIILLEHEIKQTDLVNLDASKLKAYKRAGFSDAHIAKLMQLDESSIRKHRKQLQVLPVFKRVDTCAGEFSTDTAYLYSSYEDECEARVTQQKNKVIILGGGPNRIGQGIEFDYCCVHAALALKAQGFETIMINCNPETVSTDYDTADRLYFEPITLEHVLDIVEIEQPLGVIVQYGGQTPLKLANLLKQNGVNILGTQPDAIDAAEDRNLFTQIVDRLGLKQPINDTAIALNEALIKAKAIGYPLVVRPSFVLGGRAMQTVYSDEDLTNYFHATVPSDNQSPILLDKFLENAIEVDVDAIFDGENLLIGGIMQHIEQAGIHSGDSACALPPYSLSKEIQEALKKQTFLLAKALKVVGLMNVQFAVQNNDIYLIEVNPRAARTIPFVSKATNTPLAKIAAKVMCGESLAAQNQLTMAMPEYYSVKEVVFPFNKFLGVDPILGPEMRSTGEVMGIGKTFPEAFAKAMLGANTKIQLFSSFASQFNTDLTGISDESDKMPKYTSDFSKKKALVYLNEQHTGKDSFKDILKLLLDLGYAVDVILDEQSEGIHQIGVKFLSLKDNHALICEAIKNGVYDYLLICASSKNEVGLTKDLRKLALVSHTHLDTTINAAKASLAALSVNPRSEVISLQRLAQLYAQ